VNKHSTPILAAVRAMHADEDARGHDPYDRGSRRYIDPESNITDAQKADASAILSCYTTELTLEDAS
jgi:hypothetical protein